MERKSALFIFAVGLLLAYAAVGQCETVKVDPSAVIVPRWEGWGCSLSWWGVYSENWSKQARREVCRRIFSTDKDALGFTICRYNAGGVAKDADTKPYRPGAAVRTVLDRDGAWAPERDAGQIDCTLLAKSFGADTFELFVNSPPYWMLKNGNPRGGDDGKENLKPECQKEFADWVVNVAEKLRKTYGLRFQYLEPFNEPSAGWWDGAKSSQEGSKVDWPTQANVLKHLKQAIVQSKQPYKIAASDENGAREAYNTLEWLTAAAPNGGGLKADVIQKLNTHAYWGWEWQDRLRELAAKNKIPQVWMSEVSQRESENAGFVPNDMRCALGNTRSLVSDIRRLHCGAWIYWQTVEPMQFGLWYHYTYGLMPAAVDKDVEWNGLTYKPGEFVITKAYHAIRQFSAFIRPGDRLVASGEEWTLAAISPKLKRLTLVVHNDEKRAKPYSFDLSAFRLKDASVRVWRTADDADGAVYNCTELKPLKITAKRFTDIIPASSVTTYVVGIAQK